MYNYYLEFIDIAVEISKRLPEYSSKFSKKDFTQRQLMTLYFLKQKSKLSYDDFIEDFSTRTSAIEDLCLKKLPSPSTLKMFVNRIDTNLLEQMIADCIQLTNQKIPLYLPTLKSVGLFGILGCSEMLIHMLKHVVFAKHF